jgi:hypothetical protein
MLIPDTVLPAYEGDRAILKGSEMRSRRANILVHETAEAITTLNRSIT